ncbi:MAG: helix-turn-helix transcriptional regulator [Clostridia bacterium]|nr:helix-turn-helix transcriptional regulator [Clostridia bacterium]
MNIEKVGEQIAVLRKSKALTQSELGERLGVSFQAVSKWERGETLPDITLLPDLAKILETTIDFILLGSEKVIEYKGKFTVTDVKKGLNCLKNVGEYLGTENIIYRAAIKGINTELNTNIEEAFSNDYVFEAFLAEAIIQNLISGLYVDISDVKNNFKHEHFKNIVVDYCNRHGIK